MATPTARRDRSISMSLLAASSLFAAACSGGDSATAPTVAAASPVVTTVAPSVTTTPTTDAGGSETTTSADAGEPADESDGAPATTDSIAAEPAPPSTDSGETAPPSTAAETGPTTTRPSDERPDGIDWAGIAGELLARHFDIPRAPSLELVREVCLEPSGCFDDAARTVDVLQRDGVRLRGGTPFDITSVEFQSTVDGAPAESSLAVNLIIRFVATEQGTVTLVDADGNTVGEVPTDDRFTPGQRTARAVILGRVDVTAGWKLVALSDWM